MNLLKLIILNFIIFFSFFSLKVFGGEVDTTTTSYTSDNNTECSGSINSISGEKFIPTSNDYSVASDGDMDCSSYVFYSGEWSDYIDRYNIESCNDVVGNHSYVTDMKCYDSSNNELDCDSSRSKYKIYCMYEFLNENVKIETGSFNNFGIANGYPEEIKIYFPFEDHDLESNISTLKFHFDITDNTSINWYTEDKNTIGDSCVSIDNTDSDYFNADIRSVEYDNVNNSTFKGDSDGNGLNDYLGFIYKFYNPTFEANSIQNGFMFNTIKYDIAFSDGGSVTDKLYSFDLSNQKVDNIDIPLVISNLYDTSFDGEQYLSGFLEGVVQSGSIIITKNISAYDVNGKILLTKTGSARNNFNGTGAINTDILNGKKIDIGPVGDLTNSYNFYDTINDTEEKNLNTFFTLNPFASDIDDIKNLYIDSYIRYDIDGRTITYKGNTLGGDRGQLNEGLKIYGLTNISDKKLKEITQDQDNDSIHNINGKIDKLSIKKNIRYKAYSLIKNIEIDSSHNSGQPILIGDKYIYYNFSGGNEGGIKEFEIDNGDLNINKTIIVYGGNIYLTCSGDFTCGTNGDFLPGLIVLSDNNGNGGKLYIDPNINRVDAVIYVDKSILSYNDFYGEISPSNGGTYEVLKNQLFIKGSIISENTIGGSRLDPLKCPFYLYKNSGFVCDLETAQKYDLNYLRKGVENKTDSSLGDFPVIIKYNSQIQVNPPALFSN